MTNKRRKNVTKSTLVPIKGWNVADPLPNIGFEYAVKLDNVFCLPSRLITRKGYTKHATGFTGQCKSILLYNPSSGIEERFGAVENGASNSIYDVTAAGAVGAAVVSGLTSSQFAQANFATLGGHFGIYVNGADDLLLYDGSTWAAVNGSSTPYAITGVSTDELIDVTPFKRRLWFVQKNTMACWYLPTDSIAGAATKFDFSPIFKLGGKIIKIDSWSIDAGFGLDDQFLVFTSEGEVAIYRGTDPASASTWSLIGVFYIGSPVNPGRTIKYGGDLLIINRDGIAQMSKSLMSSRVSTQLQLTNKIQPKLSDDVVKYGNNYGWDIVLFPPEDMLIINIPISDSASHQYVMNTLSGAWSRWTGMKAFCLSFSEENMYFGGNGFVGQMWNGNSDDGSIITSEVLSGYENFGDQSRLKQFLMGRLNLGIESSAVYGMRIETEFKLDPKKIDLPFSPTTTDAVYGTAKYGSSVYGGDITISNKWQNLSGIGYWGALHFMIKTNVGGVEIYSYDVVFESGGDF